MSYLRSDARNGLAEHVVSPTSELCQGEENARICILLQHTVVLEERDTPKSYLDLPSTLYMKVHVYKTWMTLQLVPESILALLARPFLTKEGRCLNSCLRSYAKPDSSDQIT